MNTSGMGIQRVLLTAGALFVFGIWFLIPQAAHAMITYPYILDEKSRVWFGDTTVPVITPGKTYLGLENYAHNYVNGYAHFTFTYTHDSCCFGGASPMVYVTGLDPRTTPAPIEKSTREAFRMINHLFPTDWYLYDIQFDATGYTVNLKQAGVVVVHNEYHIVNGLAQSDWVAIANRYPVFRHDFSMAFTPVPLKADAPQRIDPVIVVPGILGSAEKNGQWIIDPVFHVYDNLIDTLKANGYTEGVNLFPFGYDWRNSNYDSSQALKRKIDSIKSICNCAKMDIVAHSMGGLVTRAYVQSPDYAQDIDQLIFLGTPHKGAPGSYLMWEAGEVSNDFLGNALEIYLKRQAKKNGYTGENAVFNYVKGRPIISLQEVLPIYDYLKDATSGQLLSYPTAYPKNTFLENLNSTISSLFSSGIDIANIVGNSGSDTISKIRITHENKLPLWEHGYPQGYSSTVGDSGLEKSMGDGTVPETSSKFGNSRDVQIDSNHKGLPKEGKEEIYAKIHGGVLQSSPANKLIDKIAIFQIFSPADFVVIAPDGKRVGKNFSTNQEINEIPGAFYSGFLGDDEYVTIPDPLDGEYKIQLKGTGSGSYSFETTYITDTSSKTSEVSGTTALNQVTDITAKVDSNRPTDLPMEKKITIENFITDINESYKLRWIKDVKTRDGLLKSAQLIIKFDAKGTPKGDKKVDKILIKLMQKELDMLLGKGLLNKQAYDLFQKDLQYIHNNS